MIRTLLILLLRIYQWTISPLLAVLGGPGTGCRFLPSCSQYAVEALEKHGAWHGAGLAVRRLCRCQPWGGCGYDPVPDKLFSSPKESAPLDLICASLRPLNPLDQPPPGSLETPTR